MIFIMNVNIHFFKSWLFTEKSHATDNETMNFYYWMYFSRSFCRFCFQIIWKNNQNPLQSTSLSTKNVQFLSQRSHRKYLRTHIESPLSQWPVPLQCLIDGPCNLYPFIEKWENKFYSGSLVVKCILDFQVSVALFATLIYWPLSHEIAHLVL